MLTRTIIIILLFGLMLTPAHCESRLTWDLNGRQATPYLVDRESGETKVYNLRTGEVGIQIKDFGTLQTGRHTDPVMSDLLRNDEGEED